MFAYLTSFFILFFYSLVSLCFGTHRLLFWAAQQCIPNDFWNKYFILAFWWFHSEDGSEYLGYYSAGNGGSHSLIFPLYVPLLSIRRESEGLFLFTITDNMNLKVCLWIWNDGSAIAIFSIDITPAERIFFLFWLLGYLFFFFPSRHKVRISVKQCFEISKFTIRQRDQVFSSAFCFLWHHECHLKTVGFCCL